MLQPINLDPPANEPIELTREEIRKFEEAFKNPEFRDLFRSYMQEISSPEARQKYEAEITELERERGNSIRWVRPIGHFCFQTRRLRTHPKPQCLKTTAFQGHDTDVIVVNIASSSEIAPPVSKAAAAKGSKGSHWSIPHSITPPRPGVFNESEPCIIIDVIYHPDAFKQSAMEPILISTAIESISTKLSIYLSKSFSKLDTQQYVGTLTSTVIREQSNFISMEKPRRPLAADSSFCPQAKQLKAATGVLKEPRHSVTYQHKVNMQDFATGMGSAGAPHLPHPDALLVRFELPNVSKVESIDVDVNDKSVILNVSGLYHCVLPLPYSVAYDDCTAKWIANKSTLELHCPLSSHA